ncbi:MAG: outer membrane lipoprotein-sorting protein [Bacteroidota bacterium]
MKKMTITASLIFMLAISSLAQNITLSGTIQCVETKEYLTNALVRVDDFFTYSNEEGEFILKVPEKVAKELEIYHMGYDGFATAISKLDALNPFEIILHKVDPKPLKLNNGDDIMKEVFNRFHVNYELEDQLMLAYYKETLSAKDKIYHFAEGVVEIHIPSNVEKGPALLRPLKTRVRSTADFKHGGLYEKSGHASEMIQSWAFVDFLSKKYRWDYNYKLIGEEVHRNENVYIIDFTPKSENGYVKGRLWVDEFTFAIIRIEYHLANETEWDSETWVEEYQHHYHTYYLMRASFEGHWTEDGKPYVFNSMVVNTRIEADKEDTIPFEKFMLGSDFSFVDQSHGRFTDDYWGGYNYIKLTARERSQLQ